MLPDRRVPPLGGSALPRNRHSTAYVSNHMADEDLTPPPEPSACALPSQAEIQAGASQHLSEQEWQRRLTPDQYRVMRAHGTEPPFRNEFWDNKTPGIYNCAACESPLFASGHKFDSGTGWPSFYETIAPENVGRTVDTSYGMTRVEVHCHQCGGHLGHVFEDGPKPTRLRYCINSTSLSFIPTDELEAHGRSQFSEHAT